MKLRKTSLSIVRVPAEIRLITCKSDVSLLGQAGMNMREIRMEAHIFSGVNRVYLCWINNVWLIHLTLATSKKLTSRINSAKFRK